MIDSAKVQAEHPERKANASKYKFIRDAANGELDKGKWKLLGKQPSRSKATQGTTDHYLLRFEKESEHSFQESLILSNCFQYTKTVLDSYTALFAGVKKDVVWTNTPQEIIDELTNNFDGEGTTIQEWLSDWFMEAMTTARTPIQVVAPRDLFSYACMIPRENMRNWYSTRGEFQFFTYDSTHIKVEGIEIDYCPSIWVLTPEIVAEYQAGAGGKTLSSEDNPIKRVPVVDAWFFGGKSILAPLASLDMNLMNLDREKRKVIRNQAGMNFFVTDEGVELSKLSEKTWIKNPRDAAGNKPFWANYQAGSLADAFTYGDGLVKIIYDISRLRRQKDDVAESGIAKAIDFTNTKAVLNHMANVMQKQFPKIIKYMAGLEGNNMTAELQIGREFDTTTADAAIDTLLKELSGGFGKTFEAHQKKQYRDTYGKLPEKLKKVSDAEIDAFEENRIQAAMTGIANLEDSHDHTGENKQ